MIFIGIIIGVPIGGLLALMLGICVDSSRRERAWEAAIAASYGGTDSDEDEPMKETA